MNGKIKPLHLEGPEKEPLLAQYSAPQVGDQVVREPVLGAGTVTTTADLAHVGRRVDLHLRGQDLGAAAAPPIAWRSATSGRIWSASHAPPS